MLLQRVRRARPGPAGRASTSGAERRVPLEPENLDLVLPGYTMQRMVAASTRFEVYQAWSLARSSAVVVKIARHAAGEQGDERILREGRCLTGLNHPHLIRLYEILEQPKPALVLEVLSGPTLGQLFTHQRRLKPLEVAVMGRQVAAALWYLHGRDLLHCDLKPNNLIVEGQFAKVIDLSGARAPGHYPRRHGTQGYLSPEQANVEAVSAATDVWGLGMLMLEALADRDPFPRGCPEYRADHGPLAAPPAWKRGHRVPPALADLVDACCAFDPAQRPSVAQVIEVLDPFVPEAPAPPTRA